MDFLNVAMRFLHILSAVTLLGGILAWRVGVLPPLAAMNAEARQKIDNAMAAGWRPTVLFSMLGLLISGVYNFLRWDRAGLSKAYHATIGIKFLLVLHVFAVATLAFRPDNARRSRQLTGVAISGVVIVLISAILNWLRTS